MGIAQIEEIVTTVKAILKTLECPICLDLLKTPVSAGCGHFFCRECVSGILQSTYRAPCPLCKRSFTRRSIQEAAQRQSVIAAARVLANTCTNLTEVQFYANNDTTVKETKKADEDFVAPPKKPKVSKLDNQDASSRKRKSSEIEGNVKTSDCQNSPEKGVETSENLADDYLSPNKRVCPDIDNSDSEELPKLEDIFSEMTNSRKSSNAFLKNEKVSEKPLTIFPTDKVSAIKTYASIHKKTHKSNLSRTSSEDTSKCKRASLPDKNNKDILLERNEAKIYSPVKNNTTSVQEKNKLNALKNKTNEVQSGVSVVQNDSITKVKNVSGNNKVAKSDIANKSKENALCLSPKAKKIDKLRRKSQTKLLNSDANLSSKDSSDEISLKTVKNSNIKECCITLDQVALQSETVKENEDCPQKQNDDANKLVDLTDTAVSVDSVTSPLSAKNLSLSKSPGWSRVRKVEKDFKMKKFTSLHVEKNSPNVSNKDATASEQDTLSTVHKSDNSVDAIIQNRNEDRSSDFTKEDTTNIIPEDSSLVPEKATDVLNGNAALSNKEMDSNMDSENDDGKSDMNFEKMDYSESIENECVVANSEHHVENNKNRNVTPEVRIVPSLSITSNSLICTKFANANDKLSSHNILKSQKIMCELKQTASANRDLISQNGSFISKYIQDNAFNGKENKKLLFDNPSDLNQASFTLPTPFTDYQSFHTQQAKSDDNFQYVEQSQQTSQVFNLDLQNPFIDNLRAVVPHQPPLLICPNKQNTKVVKRICLTLEEIQDCFLKSSQSGSSETLCSVPFFSGLFKLHIGVADETLNVSILKVIDLESEPNNLSNTVSVLSDKGIQASSSLFPPNEVVPSSNAGSESSQPDSAPDPFPYLNKESAEKLSQQKPMHVVSDLLDETAMPLTEPNLNDKIVAMQDEPALLIDHSSVKNNVQVETLKSDSDDNCINEDNLEMSEIIHFPSKPAENNPDQKNSSPSKSVPEIEKCEDLPSEKSYALKECKKIFSNEVNSDGAAECLDQSGNKNQSLSDINISRRNKSVRGKKSSDNSLFDKTNNSSKSEHMSFDGFSSSDEDESLKKLQQCILKEQAPVGKKQSRLSLKKKKTSFRRIHLQESSDESDSENSVSVKEKSKEAEKDVFAKPENPPKLVSAAESFSSLRDLNFGDDAKKNLFSSAPAEMPSTLSSILSEDATEGNASDIIEEIEDLSDKIKSLEEKLKLCGHGENKHHRADSDSEDSIDLFPQSVPPTPPNKM